MRFYKVCTLLTVMALAAGVLTACSGEKGEVSDPANEQIEEKEEGSADDRVVFRPVDCGLQAQAKYEYPFLGMEIKLSEPILEKLESREVFAYTEEDYADSNAISYAVIRFSETTEEQREEEGMSVDIFSWEAALEKIGAIGVYQKNVISQLDELTGCDTHKKIGASSDGAYEYYLSRNSAGDQKLAEELAASDIVLSTIHEFDLNEGDTAFSMDRIDGVANAGPFQTEDVSGETYTEEVFQDYDLTLVNVFATWCSPCVQEIPELEELRQEYAEKGIKLGVVGVVMDTKTSGGTDEGAVERAVALREKSGAKFPFLLPDDGNMNGRLTGIQSYPETFFVDKDGKIVSEPYVGARSKEEWAKIVEQEFAE